jgi:hypothetical protein
MHLSLDTAYIVCSRIGGVALVLNSLEELSLLRDFQPGGRYDANVMTVGLRGSDTGLVRTMAVRVEPLVGALALRLACGITLIALAQVYEAMTIAWVIAAATTFYFRWRHRFGGEDGGDQMLSIMSATFTLCLALGFGNGVLEAGVLFMGAQAILAYTTAGIAKLASAQWRSGMAMRGILSTRTYGMRSLATVVQKWPALAYVLCWGTISLETAFVVAPMLPQQALLVLVAVAAMFHVAVAIAMGLNGFVWSFVATYPAIFYLNQVVTEHL